MADGRLRAPRIRMPRISLPTRRRGDTSAATAEAPTKEAATKEAPRTEAATKEAAEPQASKRKAPEPNLQERMEGLQGWMAELERKQARMTYFGGAAVLIAILAAGAALYFGITAKNDSAKGSDLDALTKKVDSLQGAVAKNTKDTQNALNATVTGLQATIAELQKKQAQDAANLSTLQSQITAGALSKGAGAGAVVGTPGTPGTPGTTTTTPKKP